jgi:hypothetical protein
MFVFRDMCDQFMYVKYYKHIIYNNYLYIYTIYLIKKNSSILIGYRLYVRVHTQRDKLTKSKTLQEKSLHFNVFLL